MYTIYSYFSRKLLFLFSRNMLNWSKVTVRTFIIAYKNVCCSFELSVHQRIMKMYYIFHKNIKHHFWRIMWSISGKQVFSVIIIFHNITVCFHSISDQINAAFFKNRLYNNLIYKIYYYLYCIVFICIYYFDENEIFVHYSRLLFNYLNVHKLH